MSRRVLALLAAGGTLAVASMATAEPAPAAKLRGEVTSSREALESEPVGLHRAGSGDGKATRIGRSRTDGDGEFEISYRRPGGADAVLYLIVGKGKAVRLAAVLGTGDVPRRVVVNERTTVAFGYALAQFLDGARSIAGDAPGLQNATAMADNLADVRSGHVSRVLKRGPNGGQTVSLQTFNSLANMLVRCARSARRCNELFRGATPPGGSAPRGTLEAVGDIARNPGRHVRRLFNLARAVPTPYRPALTQDEKPDAWTLALRFDGDGMSLDGPGNFAIDAEGNLWVNNNYNYGADPREPQCASDELFKFLPDGSFAPGSPFTGGGLSGAGFGITIAPDGNIWVGNFGFQGVGCTDPPPRNSVSELTADGDAVSPDVTGYTAGPIDQPQGTVSDRDGNIWIANCGNDTVTIYPGGDPSRSLVAADIGIGGPFGIAINQRGQGFIAGNSSSSVATLNPDGTPTASSPITAGGIDRPMGVATDSRGNVWVANFSVPFICEQPQPPFDVGGSVTLLNSDGVPVEGSPFTGGGIKLPWGIAVDGDDNVWIANFARRTVGHVCGLRTRTCPPSTGTGDAIAPDTGYGFDGLTRNTGIAIDPSGNVWLANNWLQVPFQTNPGGHQIVALVGAAAPVKTPVIGPPE